MAKQLSEAECTAISAEIRALLELRDDKGRRLWTQASLGAACGVSQEAIRRACIPAGVWPAVLDGILSVTAQTPAALLAKHQRIVAGRPQQTIADTTAQTFPGADFGRSPANASLDTRLVALNVIAALEKDGILREDAKRAVADLLFEGGRWDTEADLYRQARADLETKTSGKKIKETVTMVGRPVRRKAR